MTRDDIITELRQQILRKTDQLINIREADEILEKLESMLVRFNREGHLSLVRSAMFIPTNPSKE